MKTFHQFRVQVASADDAAAISQLICENTDRVEGNAYSARQKQAWKASNTPSAIRQQLNERQVFCCWEEKELVGVIGLKGQEVVGLYVHPDHLRKGIGQLLLEYLENYARQADRTALYLFATPAGYPFYLRNAYLPIGEEDVIVRGVSFRETKMHKRLI